MQKVTINGVQYLGKLKIGDEGMALIGAMTVEEVNRKTIGEYLKRKNLGELQTIEFGGMGVSYAIADLSDEEQMVLDMGKLAMKTAKKKAAAGLENDLFDKFLGNM